MLMAVVPVPGEKLEEDIVDPLEESVPSGHSGIIVSRPARPARPALRHAIREMESLAAEARVGELATRMKTLAGQPLHPEPVEVA